MNSKYLWLVASLFVGALAIAACSDDEEQNGNATTITPVNYETTGGSGTVTMNDGRVVTLNVQKCSNESANGASILGDKLTVSLYNFSDNADGSYSDNSCYVTVEGYSANQSTYENVSFSFSENEGRNYMNCQSIVSETRGEGYGNKLTVTKLNDGSYRIQLEGDVVFSANDVSVEDNSVSNATLSIEFVVPVVSSTLSTGVTSKNASFPDFTPWLNGKKADGALQIEANQMVTSGVLLWYNDASLTYADYEDLKAQATKALGEPVECFDAASGISSGDNGEWKEIACSFFYKDGNFIMVSFCPWCTEGPMPEGWASVQEAHVARIQVHALEGLTFDYTALINKHW